MSGRAVSAAVVLTTAVSMEPISAAVHRRYGHGRGWWLHRSHHESPVRGPEANDVIPAVSALVTMGLFALGVWHPRCGRLVAVAGGATLYGAAYFTVHDLYIHRRLAVMPVRIGCLEPFKRAHLLHHETGVGYWGIFSRATSDDVGEAERLGAVVT